MTSTRSSRLDRRSPPKGIDRRLFLMGAIPLLASCSSDPNSPISSGTVMLRQSLKMFQGSQDIGLNDAAKVPFASIGVRVGDIDQQLLALAQETGTDCVWTSSTRISIETMAGRIVTTAGLPFNLGRTYFNGNDPLALAPAQIHSGIESARTIDLPDKNWYQVSVLSKLEVGGNVTIDILGAPIHAIYVRETCTSPALDWDFTNEFWMDPASGLVWQSMQTVHPDLDAIQIQTLRPPG